MELHHVCVVVGDPNYEQRCPTWIVYVSVLLTLCSNSTSGGKPIAFAIALSISKPGFSILPSCAALDTYERVTTPPLASSRSRPPHLLPSGRR